MSLIYKYLFRIAGSAFFLISVALVLVKGQNPDPFFTNYTTENGLSDNSVNCITRDRTGFLWVGTMAGLNRFNGYNFAIYKSIGTDSTTIPSNRINCLHPDSRGRLWVGTFNGAAVYNAKTNDFVRIACRDTNGKKLHDFEVFAIYEDSRNRIFMATNGKGLLLYHEADSILKPYHKNPLKLFGNSVNSITEIQRGTYVMNTRTSIIRISEYPHLNIVHDLRKPGAGLITLVKTASVQNHPDQVWAATWGKGLMHMDLNTGQYSTYLFEESTPENLTNIVLDIFRFNDSTLWLSTNRGILPFDVNKKSYGKPLRDQYNPVPVVHIQVNMIYKDRDGIIWIGSQWGLSNINPEKQGLSRHLLWKHPGIDLACFDESENKIYGTRFYHHRSLVIYDQITGMKKEYPIPGLDAIRAEPFSLSKDQYGKIWIGTTKGLYSFDEKSGKFTVPDLLLYTGIENSKHYITDITIDQTGNVWFADYGQGLLKYNYPSGHFDTIYTLNNNSVSLTLKYIIRIKYLNGKLYMLSESKGMIVLDTSTDQFRHYDCSSDKYALLQGAADMDITPDGSIIYISSKNNGLLSINSDGHIRSYVKDQTGNIIDEQTELVYGRDHTVWVASNKGLHRFSPDKGTFVHYSAQNGLPDKTIGNTLTVMNDGSIAFIVFKGLYRIVPQELHERSVPLPVHLVSFKINGLPAPFSVFADMQDTLLLQHQENNFTIEFAAINFTNPQNTLYSYMLEGSNNAWSTFSPTRTIQFSDVKPGHYKLRIRTERNEIEKSVAIIIIPAWWQTRWFRYVSIILLLLFGYLVVRYFIAQRFRRRIATLEKQEEIANIRMRISRDIHDEIGSGLTRIKLMSMNLLRQNQNNSFSGELTNKIMEESDELIKNLSEIVWTINPANDTLENILAYMRNYTARFFTNHPQILLTLQFPEPESIPQGVIINPEIKRTLMMIHKEALNNVIRHSGAEHVTVTINANTSHIEMRVADNGKGINENKIPGNGIINMRKRAEFINALLEIESSPTTGTHVKISIPLV